MEISNASIRQVSPPSVEVAAKLIDQYRWRVSEADRSLLGMILTEPIEYVDHELFRKHNVETILFGDTPALQHGATSFEELSSLCDLDFAGITEETNLTGTQEIFLFQRYNYARLRLGEILCQFSLDTSFDDVRQLLAWAHRAMDTREQLSRSNLPLVLAMAKRTRLNGLDFNELISEGNYALLRSVDKFDCSRGFKFSTYACRAILKSFSRVAMRTSRYRGQFPTEFDPLMEKSDFVDRKRDDLEGQCVDEIRDILFHNRAELNEVERIVIRERFALDSPTLPAKPKTLEQVGEMIGVTKERVRQIQNKALQKIRMLLDNTLAA